MINKTITAAVALSLVLALPGVAMAQTADEPAPDRTVAEQTMDSQRLNIVNRIKERAQQAIDRRFETIDRLRTALNERGHATAGHKADLFVDLNEAEAGLRTLSREIQAATTVDQLRVLVPKIATDFRIYLVVAPKIREVIAGDTAVWVVNNPGAEAYERISAAVDRANQAGYDVTEAQAALQEMQTHMSKAEAYAGPVPNQVIDLGASDWENPAKALLRQGRDKLLQARDELRAARDSARAAVQALRDAIHDGSTDLAA
ncbi:hypothetical protein BMS3Abin02_01659 [bacterium BMS3Abin02]|nr:hypothetical protein BMS3Abin02_01659 [bacterium BMS3Abin02]GBE21082.1 hypothetical protein BMS3Bbin01_00423 [bacterium BMS3Bbin01]HDH24956.1 hypothetical protein [Actinomycetota bacterium]